MNTIIKGTALSSSGCDVAHEVQQPRRPRRSLFRHMNGQYWRVARRRRVLFNISLVFRDDLTIFPMQCWEAAAHLIALRRAAQHVQRFYCSLDPQSMKLVKPWGTIAKLADFDSQVTELLLCIVAMLEAIEKGQIYTRVQMHVIIRELFPQLLTCFEDVTSQLRALLEKAKARGEQGGSRV